MQLWKFERTDHWGYDLDRVIVIAAEDEQDARQVLATVKYGQAPRVWFTEHMKTSLVGEAPSGTARGVVTASGDY